MSFSYGGAPFSSPLDEVRFLIHDVDHDNPLLQDEEVEYVIDRQATVWNDPLMAAAVCADLIADRYVNEVSISADGVSYSGDQLQQKYQALATSLRNTYKALSGVGGAPSVGGIDRDGFRDPSVKPLNFGVGMHDNLWAGRQNYGDRGQIPDYPDRDDWGTGMGSP